MTGGVVVVLGPTGRNFAAGMSGGIAYVLDEDKSFAKRCNLSMVDLEPVEEEEELSRTLYHSGGDMETKGRIDILSGMGGHDEERLLQLIRNHLTFTGSTRAKHILDNWADFRARFVKVMPVEYRRALKEMEQQQRLLAAE
jgi:glutamate synthase (NADPH/NADH) large chain